MDRDRLLFAKTGRARFISHLDLMRTFQRAFLRAEVPIKHTEGFNPHPFVSIALPLSVGFESRCEILECVLMPGVDRASVPGKLTAALPEGIEVLDCYAGGRPIRELCWLNYALDIVCSEEQGKTIRTAWTELLSRESWVVDKPSKKAKTGSVSIDIATLVKGFDFTENPEGLTLRATLSAQNPGLNPQVLTGALLEAAPGTEPQAITYRRLEVLDREGQVFR